MNYTVAITENVQLGNFVSIDKTGNKYDVWYHGEDVKAHRTFDSMDEAYAVYEKLAKTVVFGYYSDEDKVKILKGEKDI